MNDLNDYYVRDNIEDFIFGGNSSFTIRNEVSGKGVKYHVSSNDRGDTWFVKIMSSGAFIYAGYIRKDNGFYKYSKGLKGSYELDSEEIKGLCWVLRHSKCMDSRISLLHHGRCACCGKSLNDEDSIARGFGPICYERMLAKKLN